MCQTVLCRLPTRSNSYAYSRRRCLRSGPLACAVRHETGRLQSVVDVSWLEQSLTESRTKVLDASWYLPRHGRDPVAEYREGHIPGAQYFDLATVSDRASSLPCMLPSETGFAAAADALGIEAMDHVIVYDGMGLFSAGRVWWMFKVFGHQKVSLLNGGFSAWKAAGRDTEAGTDLTDDEILKASIACANAEEGQTQYPAKLNRAQVRGFDQMRRLLKTGEEQVIDSRMRSGHMPGGLNIPCASLVTEEGYLKSKEELLNLMIDAGVDMEQDAVATCGSGVTACAVALVLDHVAFKNHVAVYDGSWNEWGTRSDTEIEV